MSSINPINVNAQGINGGYGFGAKPKAEQEEAKKPEEVQAGAAKTPVAADDVLSFMAQTAAIAAPKTIDTSKYVDKESEARIAGFMADFEDIVAKNLSAITAEFPEISEKSAMAVALAQVEG